MPALCLYSNRLVIGIEKILQLARHEQIIRYDLIYTTHMIAVGTVSLARRTSHFGSYSSYFISWILWEDGTCRNNFSIPKLFTISTFTKGMMRWWCFSEFHRISYISVVLRKVLSIVLVGGFIWKRRNEACSASLMGDSCSFRVYLTEILPYDIESNISRVVAGRFQVGHTSSHVTSRHITSYHVTTTIGRPVNCRCR